MIALAEFLIILLIILAVLLQSINLRIVQSERLTVEISFTILSLQINPDKAPRKGKQKPTKKLARSIFILRLANDLLRRSSVHVSSYRPFEASVIRSPAKLILASIYAPLILLYLKNSAGTYIESSENDVALDIRITFLLLSAFISLFKASYYTLKSKIKRGFKRA